MISVITREEQPCDVRLRLDWEMARHATDRPRGMPPGAGRLPPLFPPPGLSLQDLGGGGGGNRWTSNARVQTARPVSELEAHFAAQLAEAGWTRVAGGADQVVGWSSWRLPGEGDWPGLLLVLAAFGEGERSLTVQVESSERSAGGWAGGTATSSLIRA